MTSVIKTVLLTIFLFLVALNPTSAQDASPHPGASMPTQKFIQERTDRKEKLREQIEAHRADMAAKRDQFQENKEERIASHTAALSESRKARARERYSRLSTRISAAMGRLDTLITRIESRLAVIEENNPDADTTQIESEIATAKSLLLDAQIDLEAANDNFEEVFESEDPKATFQFIKDTVVGVKEKLVEVHRTLVSVIGDIKGLRVGNTTQLDNQ